MSEEYVSVDMINDGDLPAELVREFTEQHKKFAFAESCTGGLIAKLITDVPGASKVFSAGIVPYSATAKENILGVSKRTIAKHGIVSAQTAAEMAEGARIIANTNVAIGVTGFAGSGGDEFADIGTVYIALSDGNNVYVHRIDLPDGSRSEVRLAAATEALHMLHQYVMGRSSEMATPAPVKKLHVDVEGSRRKRLPWYKRFVRFFTDFPRDSLGEKIRKIVIAVALIVMIIAAFKIGESVYYNYAAGVTHNRIEELENQVNELTDEEKQDIRDDITSGLVEDGVIDEGEEISDWALLLLQTNPDLVGKVVISTEDDDAFFNQKVVQSKDNKDYLKHDFFGYYNTLGCAFADYRCKNRDAVTNYIIYGHSNTTGNKMFNPLHNYKKLSFYNANPVITYYTITGVEQYKIFSVMIIDVHDNSLPEDLYTGCYYTGKEFYSEIENIRNRSIFDTAVDINETDKFLTLSTCTFELKNLRLVICARKVRDGESLTVAPASNNLDAIYFTRWYEKTGKDAPSLPSDEPIHPDTSSYASSEIPSSDIPSDIISDISSNIASEVSSEMPVEQVFRMYNLSLHCDENENVSAYVPYVSTYEDDCSIGIAKKPEHGSVYLNSNDNSFTYTAEKDFMGIVTFTLSLTDSSGIRSSEGIVTVYVGTKQLTGVTVTANTVKKTCKAGSTVSGTLGASSVAKKKLHYIITSTDGPFSGEAMVDELTGEFTYTSTRTKQYADTVRFVVYDEDDEARVVILSINSTKQFENDAPTG